MTALIFFDPDRFLNPLNASRRPMVVISSCLAGEPVRYDGTPRATTELTLLRENLRLEPVCPETGAGLSVPRPPVQLMADEGEPVRVLGRDDDQLDVTTRLARYADVTSAALRDRRPRPAGYLWKSRSPSCGWGTTPLYDRHGQLRAVTDGIQAAQIRARLPWLACADEAAVAERRAAERFILICRLVDDVINEPRPLARLRSAHQPLAALVAAATAQALARCIAQDDRIGYAAELSAAGLADEPNQWLAAFGRRAG